MKCEKLDLKKGLNVDVVHLNTLLDLENTMVVNAIALNVVIRHLLIQQILFFIALEKATNGLHFLIVCSKVIPYENLLKS